MRRKIIQISVLGVALVLGPVLVHGAPAWVVPASPPSGNVDMPLDEGSTPQPKVAGLLLSTGSNKNGLIVENGNVGVGVTDTPCSDGTQPDCIIYKLQVGKLGAANGTVGASAFFYTSDATFKDNIATLSGALSKVLQLRGVSYNWKDGGRSDIGLIAQEVKKVYPEVVTGKEGAMAVDYGHLVGALVEAIKAQQTQIDALRAEVDQLKSGK